MDYLTQNHSWEKSKASNNLPSLELFKMMIKVLKKNLKKKKEKYLCRGREKEEESEGLNLFLLLF